MNLVVIPFHDWKKCEQEGFRTRDAHFMEEFGKHPQVEKLLVINRPTSLAESLLLRKNWKVRNGTILSATLTTCISQVGKKTYTFDSRVPDFVRPLLLQRKWIPSAFGKQSVVKGINRALDLLDIKQEYSLFISAPLFVPLIRQLSPRFFAFDAQDNLLKQALYKNVPNLADYYEYCIREADVISANSAETVRWLSQTRADAQLIANGVAPEVFNPSCSYPIPADIEKIPNPKVGYAGKMQEMFDVQLMCTVAEKMSNINFVFIGQQLNPQWMQPLWRYPNVFYLGDKQYTSLPSYLASFDICIIPYRPEAQHGGDPIKFYEYLSMGKPIVTTDIGGVSSFKEYPQVCIANSTEHFIEGLESFLRKLQKKETIPTMAVPAETYWHSKADKIIQKIGSLADIS